VAALSLVSLLVGVLNGILAIWSISERVAAKRRPAPSHPLEPALREIAAAIWELPKTAEPEPEPEPEPEAQP
jgi:hypothetical protein